MLFVRAPACVSIANSILNEKCVCRTEDEAGTCKVMEKYPDVRHLMRYPCASPSGGAVSNVWSCAAGELANS